MNPREIQIKDYTYDLPDARIAKYPLSRRDSSKLLVSHPDGTISQTSFAKIADYLPEGALMVFNNTKVIQARLHFHKETGALIEVFLLEPAAPTDYEQVFQTRKQCAWLCMVGNLKKWKEGPLKRQISVGDATVTLNAVREEMQGTSHRVVFSWDDDTVSFADILEAMGELPIPPYLNRNTEESDKTTYQTVYSKIKGSVAAPTAGLHFTPEVLATLSDRQIDREELTLHVGAGTFKPVKSSDIGHHDMHTEHVCVNKTTLEKLLSHDCQAIAVGTTSVRTLESLYYMGLKVMRNKDIAESQLHVSQWEPYEASETDSELPTAQESIRALLDWLNRNAMQQLHSSTQIIIAPGYRYRIVNILVTNFHQPQSTLLLLVGAFVGERWREIYRYALDNDFRFLSYGDSSLLFRQE